MAHAAQRIVADEPRLETFEIEILLPQQFADQRKLESSALPEKRLMLAILEDVVAIFQRCVRAGTPRDQRLFREAEEWMKCEETAGVFSFESICSVLDLDADSVRKALAAWKGRRLGASTVSPYRSPFRHNNGRKSPVSLSTRGQKYGDVGRRSSWSPARRDDEE